MGTRKDDTGPFDGGRLSVVVGAISGRDPNLPQILAAGATPSAIAVPLSPSIVLETDPPLHDRTRKVLNRMLSPVIIRP